MRKLMKYEFRKMRTTLLIMLAALAALEAGYPRNEVYRAKLKIGEMFEE